MNTRVLGSILIVGSLAVALNSFRSADAFDLIGSIALMLWCISGVFGLIGMLQLNALGQNPVARAFGFLPILGFVTIILSDSLRLAGVYPMGTPVNNALAAIGWIAILAGMLVVGIITIAAKTWTGWRRFVPLLIIVFVPVSLGLGSLIGDTKVSGAVAYLAWIMLGYVIMTGASVQQLRPAVNG
jgi:hypothetical protein